LEARLIRDQCVKDAGNTDARGLRIKDAHIRGGLDLSSITVTFPLDFENCVFDEPLMLDGATLQTLGLRNCALPSVVANGLHVRRDLDLSGSMIAGSTRTSASYSHRAAVWLCEAEIGGRLLCLATRIDAGHDRAIMADRMRLTGAARLLRGFHATGELRLLGVHIGGSLEVAAVTLDNPNGYALVLGDAFIDGSLFVTDFPAGGEPTRIAGLVDLNSAEIGGQVLIRNLHLTPGTPAPTSLGGPHTDAQQSAFAAPRLTVGANLTIIGDTILGGGVDLSSATLGGLFIGGRCQLNNSGAVALNLTNAQLNSDVTFKQGLTIRGRTAMSRATIRGRLTLQGATLQDAEDHILLDAYSLRVDAIVALQDLTATGGRLIFNGATLGAFIAHGATITNPTGQSLNLRQAQVDGAVMLNDGFTSIGHVVLDGARIAGRLTLRGSSFTCPQPSPGNRDADAVSAITTRAEGGMNFAWKHCEPSIDLTSASTTTVVDDPTRWPRRYDLTGFTYARFDGSALIPGNPWDVNARCEWLEHAVFETGAFEHAARVFREAGFATEAEEILIRQRDASRRTRLKEAATARRTAKLLAYVRSCRDWLYGRTVGYGYRPGRVLAALVILLGLTFAAVHTPQIVNTLRSADQSAVVYTVNGPLVPGPAASASPRPDRCGNGDVRCFSPALFAIDTVVPLVNLGQRDAWYPDPHVPWGRATLYLLNAATLLGWLLSTILVLAFTRLARTI
jgi:hypothetical protein